MKRQIQAPEIPRGEWLILTAVAAMFLFQTLRIFA